MTAIVLKSLSLPRLSFNWITEVFSSIGKSMIVSRQCAANESVAKALLHEYPEHTYHSLLAELNRLTIQGAYNDK
jgi:hypothetical protein